ncbi:hypothetical protein, partial [Eisenbergiella tayi]|uniref:hypothetical protein n=1 Tax=Eisenbergiella tayi TaxID=1432052 RepID=UPI003AF0CFE4
FRPGLKCRNSVTGKLSGSEQKPDGKTGPNRYTSGFFQGAELSVILYNERNPAARYKMCGSHQADRRRARLLRCLRE